MKISQTLFLFVALIYGGLAFADCVYNGVHYPVGTVLGPYVCSGTQWVSR